MPRLVEVHDLFFDRLVKVQFVVYDVYRELSFNSLEGNVPHQGWLEVLLAKWFSYVQTVHSDGF